jgi:hypothetical protein
MIILPQIQKDEFLDKHLRHRLTLLRTLRERRKSGHSYNGEGDIYRCIKDSNLFSVRLLLDFLGLKGERTGDTYALVSRHRKTGKKYEDDVMIDQFCNGLLSPSNVPQAYHRTLAGVYCRADKELAHVTSTFNEEFNQEHVLIEAATIVESLIKKHLYESLGKELPAMDA